MNGTWIGTNHSSHAEKSVRNKFAFLIIIKIGKWFYYIVRNLRMRDSN